MDKKILKWLYDVKVSIEKKEVRVLICDPFSVISSSDQ
jgi:hypothetical protein